MIKTFVRVYWLDLLVAIFAVMSVSFMTLLLPVILGGLVQGGIQLIWETLGLYVIIFALASAFRVGAFAHLSNQMNDYFLKNGLSAIFTNPGSSPQADYRQLKSDVDKITSVCEQSISQFIRNIILTAGGLGLMVKTSWALSGLILLLLPICLLPVYLLMRRYRATLHQLSQKEQNMESIRISYVAYVEQIWHYQHEFWALNRISDQMQTMHALRRHKLVYRIILSFLAMSLVLLALIGIAYLALVINVQHLTMQTGDVLRFSVSAFLVAIAISGMSELQHQVMVMRMALGRISALIQYKKIRSKNPSQLIDLRHVNFKYQDKIILQDFTLQVADGEKIAIVGSSGVGKSTLLKIILGQISPDSGEIGHQFESCAFLMGELPCLMGSIWDNLTLGAALSEAEVHAGIDALGLEDSGIGHLDFAQPMPELSAGQKQRLDLLRAIFQKKSILVLDEATSHLDFNLQLKINDYFYSLKQTIIISSHQLDFIQRADRVIFLSGAGKVEIGPHAHLLRHSHTYRLFMKEMNGDEENAH